MIGREERRKANFGGKAFPNVLPPSVPDLQGQHANNFPMFSLPQCLTYKVNMLINTYAFKRKEKPSNSSQN